MDRRNRRTEGRRCCCGGTILREHWEDYSGATSIHGVRYLGERSRPFNERLWWIVVFVGCFTLNSYLISKVWRKWNDSPVIVSFAEVTTPVWEVPFPAVTLCSLDKYDAYELPHLKQEMISPIGTPSKEASDLSLVCNEGMDIIGNLTTDDNVVDFFRKMASPKFSQVLGLTWRGNEMTKYLQEIITEEGVCYTFNMLDAKELFRENTGIQQPDFNLSSSSWSMESGYSADASLDSSYPLRVGNSGMREALNIILTTNVLRYDYLCQGLSPGFKVTLHNPTHFPDVSGKFFKVQAGREVIVGVIPDIMTTSKALRSYSPSLRQCYFPYERHLVYFKVYNQNNCILECLTDNTIANCGCVGFYMPRTNKSVQICGSGSRYCMLQVESLMNNNIHKHSEMKDSNYTVRDCNCLPSCSSIKYKTDISVSMFEADKVLGDMGVDNDELERFKLSSLTIYFPEKQFTTSKRDELYGVVDFLANCGGLLSLFSGLSLLSIIEILYFATLRLYNKINNAKKEVQDVEIQKLDNIPDP